MFILFILVWIIFNGQFTLEILLFGIVFSLLMCLFAHKFMNYNLKNEMRMYKKMGLFIQLLIILVLEIAKANEHLIYWIFSDKYRMEPAIAIFHVDLKKDWTKALFANFITLTPGTITAYLEDDIYTVHCLDQDLADGIDNCQFLRVLERLEEE